MIKNLQISGVHSNLNGDIKSYVTEKIGKLDKYLPRRARESTFVDVKIEDKKRGAMIIHECKVIMKLPSKIITIHKDSNSAKAAVDEVEDNLKNQLKKYKDTHSSKKYKKALGAKAETI